jgi:hypothetical protein
MEIVSRNTELNETQIADIAVRSSESFSKYIEPLPLEIQTPIVGVEPIETRLQLVGIEPIETLSPIVSIEPKKVIENSTSVSDIALIASDIHTTAVSNENAAANIPSFDNTEEIYKATQKVVDSTNNPKDVQLASSTNNSDSVMTNKSGDQYFPIQLNLPSNNPTPTTNNNGVMTEEEKRKRAIMIASIILLLLIVLVSVVSRKNPSK